ncbi:MAG: butyrate kinase, partial [Oscillospiraceae bacterium]|nr:butyrate kinase [Oscillospiraceae bacterium]
LVPLCFSGKYTEKELLKKIRGKGGMYAYLGTSDAREIEKRIQAGDEQAETIYRAEAYQISKTIGMLSVVLGGRYDAIILTGGMAYSKLLTDWIRERVGFIAPVVVMAGENEMDALAQGGLRILSGQEQANVYHFPERM